MRIDLLGLSCFYRADGSSYAVSPTSRVEKVSNGRSCTYTTLYPMFDTSLTSPPPPPVFLPHPRVQKLLSLGVRDIQLRVKGASPEVLDAEVARAAQACRDAGGRLWVNDFWQAAVKHATYGVHLGQEDLEAGGREALRSISAAGLRLGLSTHSFSELAKATAVRPSYISIGPVFETTSKKVAFSPRGAGLVKAWKAVIDVPLITIGGITLETAPEVKVEKLT